MTRHYLGVSKLTTQGGHHAESLAPSERADLLGALRGFSGALKGQVDPSTAATLTEFGLDWLMHGKFYSIFWNKVEQGGTRKGNKGSEISLVRSLPELSKCGSRSLTP